MKEFIEKDLISKNRFSLYDFEIEVEESNIYYDELITNMVILLSKMSYFGAFNDEDSLLELINLLKSLIIDDPNN